jgi:protein TonB
VPPPEIDISIAPDAAPTNAIQQTTSVKPTAPPPPVAQQAPVPRTAPKSDSRRPLTQPEYPPSSRRAGEAGTVILEVYVLENGRVGEAKVKQSSGFPRLDEAAVREVKRSWRLVPGTENGKPVPMWGQFAVTFKLTD